MGTDESIALKQYYYVTTKGSFLHGTAKAVSDGTAVLSRMFIHITDPNHKEIIIGGGCAFSQDLKGAIDLTVNIDGLTILSPHNFRGC